MDAAAVCGKIPCAWTHEQVCFESELAVSCSLKVRLDWECSVCRCYATTHKALNRSHRSRVALRKSLMRWSLGTMELKDTWKGEGDHLEVQSLFIKVAATRHLI